MKHFIYLLSTLFFISCTNVETVDLAKATKEANAFIASQFDFFTQSSLELAKETFTEDAVLWDRCR